MAEPGSDRAALQAILDAQRAAFVAEGPASLAVRQHRIDRLSALLLENTEAFAEATGTDFGTRSRSASLFTEIIGILPLIEHTRKHTGRWMKPTRLMPAGRLFGLRGEVRPSPLGVAGIIGPWNFPVHLVLLPAVAALAAGNRVMIKMSEITGRTADLMAELAPRYFDETELAVVTGGPEIAATFAGLAFDHLFFTGSPEVGKRVQRAAADNLVPVTLELGGKNPVVVAPGQGAADIARAGARIATARMVNGGQVCVCPDYVLVPDQQVDRFVAAARDRLRAMFPAIIDNPDYCSSVDEPNFDRVLGLIEDARARGADVESVAPAGERLPDRGTRKIAPTLIRGVTDGMQIAEQEVFGPVLAVLGYRDLAQAMDYINARPAPLVAYWYGPGDHAFERFVRGTRSGGVARNDFAAQMIPADAPFGGVGRSGTGAYHGKAGFDAFSHYRTVVGTDLPFSLTGTAAPPFRLPMRLYADAALARARRKARRRLNRSGDHRAGGQR